MEPISLVFLDRLGNCIAPMAVALSRRLAPPYVNVAGVTNERHPVHPFVVDIINEAGSIELASLECKLISNIDITKVDLVISLSDKVTLPLSILPGTPAVIEWEIHNPCSETDNPQMDDICTLYYEIDRRIKDFFAGGYLESIVNLKNNNERLLDQFSNGILAHNTNRIITWFNTAAERITGYRRENVIGKDCHEVFQGNFCGNKCAFKTKSPPKFDHLRYPIKITHFDGSFRRVEASVVAINNARNAFQGCLLCFRDVTEVTQLRQDLKAVRSFHGIIGSDQKMQAVYDLITDLASSDCPVLIEGESGTGKELVANAIHGESPRTGNPFVTVNCGALPEGVLESELFGHVRGAFTGAIRDKKGRFELANNGTIFLDEVAELSPTMQVNLLRVLQEHTFERVGDEKSIKVDVRILSATNRDLRKMVQQGTFREDLYYRLCVVPITLPPLRQRRNDIPILIDHFLKRFNGKSSKKNIDPEAIHVMLDYHWPGNIRELQNAIQYALIKCKEPVIMPEHLPPEILLHHSKLTPLPATNQRTGKLTSQRVEKALAQTKGNKVKAAKILGVGRATLYRFLKNDPQPIELS